MASRCRLALRPQFLPHSEPGRRRRLARPSRLLHRFPTTNACRLCTSVQTRGHCNSSVTSMPVFWPKQSISHGEATAKTARGSRKQCDDYENYPPASTSLNPARRHARIDFSVTYKGSCFWHRKSTHQVCQATSFLLVPENRRQGPSSEHRDWRSLARPIHRKLLVSPWEWCVYRSWRGQIARGT